MADNLVIVESPAKAKTIQKFLGNDYVVKSSFGHIRDLQDKKLSVDVDKNFAPEYVIPADKKRVVSELKKAAEASKTVWLASDEDREGEAISWHLFETLGLKPENTQRIVFHEITKDAILNAVRNPKARYKIWKKAEKRMTSYDWDSCNEYIVLTSTIRELRNPFPKEWFHHRTARFEDMEANIMSGSEDYCHMMYGDYMKLPPEEDQCVKHKTVYIDIDNPYKKYKGLYYCKNA